MKISEILAVYERTVGVAEYGVAFFVVGLIASICVISDGIEEEKTVRTKIGVGLFIANIIGFVISFLRII